MSGGSEKASNLTERILLRIEEESSLEDFQKIVVEALQSGYSRQEIAVGSELGSMFVPEWANGIIVPKKRLRAEIILHLRRLRALRSLERLTKAKQKASKKQNA